MVTHNPLHRSGLAAFPHPALIGVPVGNSGRVNVSAFKPMPIPQDPRALLEQAQA